MQVSIETTAGLERRLTIEVPAERIDKEIHARLINLSKKVKIHGFRPGKVPFKVVKQQYENQVYSEVMQEVMQSTFMEAVTKEKLRPASMPTIVPKSRLTGEALSYTATFEIFPELTLTGFENLEIETPQVDIEDKDIDILIENIRKQRMEWKSVERPAKNEDRLTIDFIGRIDGEVFAGGEAKNTQIILGSNRMIKGFEEQLVESKINEDRTLTVQFPDDYHGKEVAGKEAIFSVKITAVEEPVLPALDDKFIEQLGIKEGGIEALRSDVRTNMQRELEEKKKNILKQNVMENLTKSNEFELPQTLVDSEIKSLAEQNKVGESSTLDDEKKKQLEQIFEKQARHRVALGLLLSEIIKQNNITVEPSKVRQLVESIASTYDKPEEIIHWYYADKFRLSQIESLALENEVVELVTNKAKLKETKMSFSDIMNLS